MFCGNTIVIELKCEMLRDSATCIRNYLKLTMFCSNAIIMELKVTIY